MSRVERQDVIESAYRGTPRAAESATFARGTVAVGAALFLWFAVTAWMRTLALPDEGRYVTVAWEMMRSGDWLTPTLDGLPYFHKPPLFYWITAASMSVFGMADWAARAAPLLGAWIGAFGLFLFVRRWSGNRVARLSLIALASMPLFYGGAQFANMDMLVAGFITVTVLLLAHAALCIEAGLPYRRSLVVAYALAALGVLSKGLIGAALPILVIVPWLLVTRRGRLVWPMISIPGVLLFFAITLPWFVALQLRFPGFLDYFFIVQQVKRFAESGFNNVRPFWFYPVVLAVASLPWLPWFGKLFRRGYLADPQQGTVRWLMLVWALAITLFFSIPKSKMPGYIFPAVPPLAFFLADALLVFGEPAPGAKRRWAASAGISAILSLAVVIGFAFFPYRSSRDLALTLAHERGPDEPLFALHEYYFDLPFYARLDRPFGVVEAWDTDRVRERDNWRKEMADAIDFQPAGAVSPLVTPAQLPARACTAKVAWFVGPASSPAQYKFLALGRVASSTREARLWRVDLARPGVAAALGCPG